MPSYEQPSRRTDREEDDPYQPSNNANTDTAESEKELADEDDERKALTWTDLAEQKTEDALAPLLEAGPRAPCQITHDGSQPESSVKRWTQAEGLSEGLKPNLRARAKQPTAKDGKENAESQPGEIEPGSFEEILSGPNAQGYPEGQKVAKQTVETEAMPEKEAFVPKRNDDFDSDVEASDSDHSSEDTDESVQKPKRRRRRRRKSDSQSLDGQGEANEQAAKPRAERKDRPARKQTGRKAAAKPEEPKGLLGKVKKAFGSLFGSAPEAAPAKEEEAPRRPKKKTARKRARKPQGKQSGNRPPRNEGESGDKPKRRRRPRKRARRSKSDENPSND
ncbi:MAG: hypothetical protein AAGF10_01670 [Verrucomicrobiota bacterium]